VASFVLINPRSGKGSPTADELAAEARTAGVQTHLPREGEDPEELARASTAEVLDMLQTPVELRVEPGVLRVLVPPAESG